MLNMYAEFHLVSMIQAIVIVPDSLYCGKLKNVQTHVMILTYVGRAQCQTILIYCTKLYFFEFHDYTHQVFSSYHVDRKKTVTQTDGYTKLHTDMSTL